MKRTLTTLILTAGVLATLGVSSLHAEERGTAVVPFAFHVNSTILPAGRYRISTLSSADKSVYNLADWKGHSSFVNGIPTGTAPVDSNLTFACYAGDCTLVKMDLGDTEVVTHSHTDNYKVGMAAMIRIRVAH